MASTVDMETILPNRLNDQAPIVRAMDACFAFKHKTPTFGGGGSYVAPALPSTVYIAANPDLLSSNAGHKRHASASVPGCDSTFVAAGPDKTKDPRCDVNGIFGVTCRHAVLEAVIDVAKGEKLLYGATVVDMLADRYPEVYLAYLFRFPDICTRYYPNFGII